MDTKNKLLEHCQKIADEIGTGTYHASDYLNDALDIEYTIDGNFEYLGTKLVVAWGPNIYIDTQHKVVRGYWGDDNVEVSYSDNGLGIDEYCRESYEESK